MARKPYIELPDILKLLPPMEDIDTDPDIGGPSGRLNQIKDLSINNYTLTDGWYDDGIFIPSRFVIATEPFGIELNEVDARGGFQEADNLEWEILKDGQVIYTKSGNLDETFTLSNYINVNQVTQFEIQAVLVRTVQRGLNQDFENRISQTELAFTAVPPPSPTNEPHIYTPVYEPFVAKILSVDGDTIEISDSYNTIVQRTRPQFQSESSQPDEQYTNWVINSKFDDRKDLNTYLRFGDDTKVLVTNVKYDNTTVPTLPYSIVYKTYEPLPDDICI